MPASAPIAVTVDPSGSWTILGRATSDDATGALSPTPTEGNLLTQGDLSSVGIAVYDPSSLTPGTPVFTASPAPSSVIFNTLQTSGIWGALAGGGNFSYRFGSTVLTAARHVYEVLVTFTTTGGTVSYGKLEVRTGALHP